MLLIIICCSLLIYICYGRTAVVAVHSLVTLFHTAVVMLQARFGQHENGGCQLGAGEP